MAKTQYTTLAIAFRVAKKSTRRDLHALARRHGFITTSELLRAVTTGLLNGTIPVPSPTDTREI